MASISETAAAPSSSTSTHGSSRAPWSRRDDMSLRLVVDIHGPKAWSVISKSFPGRSAKSCRRRWCNHLHAGIYRQPFIPEEDDAIVRFHRAYENSWAAIAELLVDCTGESVKNRWNSVLNWRFDADCRPSGTETREVTDPQQHAELHEFFAPSSASSQVEVDASSSSTAHYNDKYYGEDDPMTELTIGLPGSDLSTTRHGELVVAAVPLRAVPMESTREITV
ncbi:transcription factor MYB77-like [Typha latifolia]|uniref:transcription factor MYB77-like n=1 Tax=Typha latifolia TaxID=4733 RepID=UPI003C2D743D